MFLNKLKDMGVGGFISSTVKDTVDFTQEQKFREFDAKRQDEIAMWAQISGFNAMQSKQINTLVDHLIQNDREWNRVHDANYQSIANKMTGIEYLVKQITEKITVLISVVEGLYDRMKQHRNEEVAELRLQIEQQNQYIAALESRIEMRDDKE